MSEPMRVFDRALVRRRRARFARQFAAAGFLVEEVVERLLDRLGDIRLEFRRVLVLGAPKGLVETALAGRFGIERLVAADTEPAMLAGPGLRVAVDAEALPFAADRFDLVLSPMILHWVNDLPGTLIQLRDCLAPDGLLMLAMPGGETLTELRQCLTRAELECEGGAGPRVSPFADVRDAGSILQRRPGPLSRLTLARACQLYGALFADAESRVPATFDILFMAGWKPHPSQQQPARRGSGRTRLADALWVPGPGEEPS